MAVREGGFHREYFTIERGVTQEDQLPLTSCNAVVDAVVQHWQYQVCGRVTVEQGLGLEIG